MKCCLCGGTEGRVLRHRTWKGMKLAIVRCASCGLEQLDPVPTPSQLQAIYDASYFCCESPLQGGYENYTADEPQIRKTFMRRLQQAGVKPGERGTALDIGCATGIFLDVLRSSGWHAQGIELSPDAAKQATKRGFQVQQGDWRSVSFPDGSFDLISLWDVIEHIPEPMAVLHQCHRWLAPGGTLLISTPDVSAWLARLLGPWWLGYRSAGEHVLFLGRRTMSQFLEQSGFEVSRIQSIGKYMRLDRIVTRLGYYTRIFRILLPFKGFFISHLSPYVSSGDTMYVVARKRSI